jgi:tetratricopeptide (TPR) repeat protein
MPIIKIDDKDYETDNFSDEAKAQLTSVQFVDQELARLQAEAAILQTARIAYAKTLSDLLMVGVDNIPDFEPLDAKLLAQDFITAERDAITQINSYGRQPELLRVLGSALYGQQRTAESLIIIEEGLAASSNHLNMKNIYALILSRQKRYDEAHQVYLELLKLTSENILVLANIGANLNKAERFAEAEQYLRQGLEGAAANSPIWVNLAIALIGQRRSDEARSYLEFVLEAGFRCVEALSAYGVALQEDGESERALEVLNEALALRSDYVEALATMGSALISLGRFTAAEDTLNRVLALDPLHVQALSLLSAARKMTSSDLDWKQAVIDSLDKDQGPEQERSLRFSLGKYYDDIGNYDAAFLHYSRANALNKTLCSTYDKNSVEGLARQLMAAYPREIVQARPSGASDSELPLFIVGTPRSGTSLQEQIMAAHPGVFGAGELKFWPTAIKDRYVLDGAVTNFSAEMSESLAQAALDNLTKRSISRSNINRVVDKMPGNFWYLGLIHRVFPNARIIHTLRNPIDTCLSIYFQNFSRDHLYASDLEELAHHYRVYHQLMAHWRAALPADRFLDVPYESVVEDQEGWSRKIIDFIGLDWNDACINFHKTDRNVSTASKWQVRQPIYKTSKERWRNYEKYISPLLPLLELYNP